MTIKQGLVSTIIPVYNRPEMLAEAIDSVLNQTYRPIEIIIVNDGSTDNTLQVASSYANQHSVVKVISTENAGVAMARETGRQAANGEFIQYLDSDDMLKNNKFTDQVEALRNSPHAAACYGKTDLFCESDSTTTSAIRRTGESIASILPAMLQSRWWSTSSALYRRSVCDAAGRWADLINEEDWEYDCRIALNNNNLCYVDTTVSTFRRHTGPHLSNNGSSDLAKLASRAKAHQLIVGHALAFGYDSRTPEFEYLLIACFLLSRQCGAHGLVIESKQLLLTAKEHLKSNRRQRLKLVIYHGCCRLFGWHAMGKLAQRIDQARQ
jgi:glycosyltransferase involved in cell wall biosynthesis